MSLAYSPYEVEDSDNGDNTNNSNKPKRYALNKTMKKTPIPANSGNIDSSKVNSVLQKIHSMTYDSDEDEDNYSGGFNPPEKPISAGVLRTQELSQQNMSMSMPMPMSMPMSTSTQNTTTSLESSGPDLDVTHSFQKNYGNKESAMEYYKKFIPNFNPKKVEGFLSSYTPSPSSNEDIMRKLNYMIHLLEEQKDEKTNNVTEEVVLYCFLGIFIIFVVDSFARVGKYVR